MKARLLTQTFVLVALLIAAGMFSPQATAQDKKVKPMLSVSPTILSIQLSPGKTYTHTVTVKNLLESPLSLHADLESLQPQNGESFSINSVTPWTRITPSDMIIPAHEKRTITVTIRTPNKIKGGGYYGTLALTPLFPSVKGQSTLVQPKLIVLLLGNIGIPNITAQNAQITRFIINKNLLSKEDPKIDLEVKNTSLYHFSGKPILTFTPLLGAKKQYILDEKIILPGGVRTWNNQIKLPQSNLGLYFIDLSMSVGNGLYATRKTFFVSGPIGPTLGFIILGLCGMAIFKKRHKITKALSILISNK